MLRPLLCGGDSNSLDLQPFIHVEALLAIQTLHELSCGLPIAPAMLLASTFIVRPSEPAFAVFVFQCDVVRIQNDLPVVFICGLGLSIRSNALLGRFQRDNRDRRARRQFQIQDFLSMFPCWRITTDAPCSSFLLEDAVGAYQKELGWVLRKSAKLSATRMISSPPVILAKCPA